MQPPYATNQQGIEEVAQATKKRFTGRTEWVTKSEATVHFEVGDSTLSAEHKQEVAALAQEALNLKGYAIEVKGYADSTGKLTDNQQLSKERAQAVVAYLLQDCHVPAKNIVAGCPILRRFRRVGRFSAFDKEIPHPCTIRKDGAPS